tara:strand:+ start:11364 stop:12689 length:1326 start_codon:yes stop_codon:yes gene_type:complete
MLHPAQRYIVLLSLLCNPFAFLYAAQASTKPVKNIIIMIGDGMGVSMTSAYRYYQDNPDTPEFEASLFDRFLVGMASTHPEPVSGYVTDSAAGGTALATGYKTHNQMVSTHPHKKKLKTLLEFAQEQGKATGVVVTSQLPHATPAAFLTHHPKRFEYQKIMDKIMEHPADVMLGGGLKYLKSQHEQKLQKQGYQILKTWKQLNQIKSSKVLGLFTPVALNKAIDAVDPYHLTHMTQAALKTLSQHKSGFVLMIEGSQIDWAAHSNDIVTAMHEMQDFEQALQQVLTFTKTHPDTLVVVTADHATGGLSLGKSIAPNYHYHWDADQIRRIQHSPDYIVQHMPLNTPQRAYFAKQLGFPLKQTYWQQIKAHLKDKKQLVSILTTIINEESNTGWTTHGHTGDDVQVFAFGKQSQLFHGYQKNTDIGRHLINVVKQTPHTQDAS